MLCARCLYDGTSTSYAITIANGNALCLEHFNSSKEDVGPSANGIALAMMQNPRFSRTGA